MSAPGCSRLHCAPHDANGVALDAHLASLPTATRMAGQANALAMRIEKRMMRRDRTPPQRQFACATLIVALLSCAAPAQAAGGSEADPPFERAVLAYERNHWDEAWAGFAVLADAGDPEAARIALLMQRHAKDLYGATWIVPPEWLQHWSCVASSASQASTLGCKTPLAAR